MSFSAGSKLSPPNVMSNMEEWQRKAVAWMMQAHNGHIANTGTVTLTSGVAATVLVDARIGFATVLTFMPTTANAATEVATMYISSQSKGAATIAHANAATGDRTFKYGLTG